MFTNVNKMSQAAHTVDSEHLSTPAKRARQNSQRSSMRPSLSIRRSLECYFAALMSPINNGCALFGRLLNSG